MVRHVKERPEEAYTIFAKKRRKVGRYSGAVRDFKKELELKEPDPDDFREWLKNLSLKGPEFKNAADKQWELWTNKEGGWDFNDGRKLFWCGQSHIDIAWEWRMAQTIAKVLVTYSKAAYHCEKVPGFVFAGSQALTYEFVRQRDPDLFKKIQELHAKGKWEIVGGSWVEPDCRMPSGESFIRQRLHGQHFFLKYFNTLPKVEWTPDTFGYAWSMPQILKKSGAEFFFTTKVWGNRKEFPDAPWPFTNFNWRGPDGSEILTHVKPQMFYPINAWPEIRKKSNLVKEGEVLVANYNTYRPDLHPALSSKPDDYVKELGIFYGLGDGGHGPTGKEVAVVEYWRSQGKGEYLPVHDYFKILEGYKSRLPTWNDELYFQYHQGTLTTQGMIKRGIRMLEWRLAGLEAVCTLIEMISGGIEREYSYIFPNAKFNQAWKDVLTNHFHDIFPGSSIPEVYDDTYDHFIQDIEILNEIENELFVYIKDAIDDIEDGYNIIIMNPMGFARTSVVSLEILDNLMGNPKFIQIKRATGDAILKEIQHVKGDNDVDEPLMKRPDRLEFTMTLGPHEICTGKLISRERSNSNQHVNMVIADNSTFSIEQDDYKGILTIHNENMIIKIDRTTGAVISCIWNGKELFSGSACTLNAYFEFENSWEIQFNYRENVLELEVTSPPTIIEDGPIRITVETRYRIEDGESEIIHQISFYKNIEGIFSTVLVDWKDANVLIKMPFPLSFEARESLAEIPAGVIKRNSKPETPHDKTRWEVACQTFVDMPSPDSKWGIAFINDGKYGYSVHDNAFELTLLRKAHLPGIAKEAWCLTERKERQAKGERLPMTSDGHWHVINQLIIPHQGTIEDAAIHEVAHAFNSPVMAKIIQTSKKNKEKARRVTIPEKPLVQCLTPNIEIMAIKPWEHVISRGRPGYIIRMINMSQSEKKAEIIFSKRLDIHVALETDLLERPLEVQERFSTNDDDKSFKLSGTWKPFEIRTFLLK
ncbi:MAG: alpha-mannosidase [Promethearchaeota archaeon]